MEKINTITSTGTPLRRSDVDTDQIIPAHWLKKVERTGFGEGLFEAWRKDPDFVLNKQEYKGSEILIALENFGCGSSREHAPWALQDYGFKAIIAPSFADIFYNNCFKVGIVPVIADISEVEKLLNDVEKNPSLEITVDVETKSWSTSSLTANSFELDDFIQYRLLNGLDDIGLTLVHEDKITKFEQSRPSWMPKYN